MSKTSCIAKLTAAEGKSSELEEALHLLIAAADEEDGLEIYSVHSAGDGMFWFFELYSDQAATEMHGKNERMRAAMGSVGSLLAGRPEVTVMTPVAAKGIDV